MFSFKIYKITIIKVSGNELSELKEVTIILKMSQQLLQTFSFSLLLYLSLCFFIRRPISFSRHGIIIFYFFCLCYL